MAKTLSSAALAAVMAILSLAQASAADLKPYTEKLVGDLAEMEMLPVAGGTLTMDDPAKPGTAVKAEIKPFYLAKYETRWEVMDIFVYRLDLSDKETAAGVDAANRPSTPYIPPDRGMGHDGYPVVSVSYLSASKFCEWLSKKTGKHYRLPTEAEWLWACLAGQPLAKLDAAALGKVAVFKGHADNPNTNQPGSGESGKLAPNAWGFYDMLGNVREYCVGPEGKGVMRGGGWADDVDTCQPTSRAIPDATWQTTDPQNPKSKWWLSDAPWAGFRVVCEP